MCKIMKVFKRKSIGRISALYFDESIVLNIACFINVNFLIVLLCAV